jgi:hypothetical protein
LERFQINQKFAFPSGSKVYVFGVPLIASTLEVQSIEIAEDSTEIFSNSLDGLKICLSADISDEKQKVLKMQIKWMMGIAQYNLGSERC